MEQESEGHELRDDAQLHRVLGPVLRTRREQLGFSQEGMAMHLDISLEFYARLERGESLPGMATLFVMVTDLGVSADVFLGLSAAESVDPELARRLGACTADLLGGRGSGGVAEQARIDRILERLKGADPALTLMVRQIVDVFEDQIARAATMASAAGAKEGGE